MGRSRQGGGLEAQVFTYKWASKQHTGGKPNTLWPRQFLISFDTLPPACPPAHPLTYPPTPKKAKKANKNGQTKVSTLTGLWGCTCTLFTFHALRGLFLFLGGTGLAKGRVRFCRPACWLLQAEVLCQATATDHGFPSNYIIPRIQRLDTGPKSRDSEREWVEPCEYIE